MLAGNKTMEIARHVLKTLFQDTAFPLIQHHVDSFNDFLDTQIPTFIRASNPFELELGDRTAPGNPRRFVRVYIGGKEGTKLRYQSPTEDDGTAIVPHACRLDNRTYAVSLFATLDIEYTFADGSTEMRTFEDVLIGRIPLMLRSRYCYLTALDPYSIGECAYELGGYFLIDGAEKVLLTQELLGTNMAYAGTRKRQPPKTSAPSLVEKESAIEVDSAAFEEETETYVGIRTLSEDGTRGPYSHFLSLPSPTLDKDATVETGGALGRDRRLTLIQAPGYSQPVPVLSLFRALGVTSDRDLYDYILVGVPDKDRAVYDDLFTQIVLSHERFLANMETTDLKVLAQYTRNKSRFEVVVGLHESLFSHVESTTEDTGALFRRKAYALGEMMRMAMDIELGRRAPSDRDNLQFKRFVTSGVLMFEEFRRIYRDIGKTMLLDMDSRVQYEAANYAGKQLVNLVEPETVRRYWKGYRMMNQYERSFKGAWGGRVGIAQELARPSYLAAIHHLRKTDLQIDKTTSTAPPRRFYASQVGFTCPTDSPDGSDIGYKKSLALLAQICTAFPSSKVREVLQSTNQIRESADIHPSTWDPTWTRVYLNSDLFGAVMGNTEDFHRAMLKARREGRLPPSVSLTWMRLNNEYKIYSDAGRPIRPVYREGTKPDLVASAKRWTDIAKHLDYIDPFETDSLLLSLVPFHATRPSELHMTFNLSAAANLVPYMDHNPGPRSVFSIAQQKQAASWYHTQYKKRFDTISMMATTPQRPLSQTWLYNEMMGRGGCLPYGENALVAITVYGGENQEDSVILNGSSLRRGMYRTMYYHSYDIAEDMIDPAAQTHTKISNPIANESIRRKPDMDYSLLDADGVVRVGSYVKDDSILVGMVSPIRTPTGQITGYRDVSVGVKRGQHGRIDAVYSYATSDGLRGVKIRILEERTPQVGDKMASRHSQKGTVGRVLAEEDMPFTGSGQRPDLIFNPHGIPTRMTVGQFLEAASNKLGVELGALVDATPFTTTNRIGELRKALVDRGFEPYGSEILYNGTTGEMMEADVFMGPIYYQRLKHMVEDKLNYRDTGPKTLMTHQPTQGRADEGGLRIGEMERDALIGHGMSKFLDESLMDRSDKTTFLFNKEEGRIDTSRDTHDMPYSMGLMLQELEAMHVTMRMQTD